MGRIECHPLATDPMEFQRRSASCHLVLMVVLAMSYWRM